MVNVFLRFSKIDTASVLGSIIHPAPSNLDEEDFCLYATEYCREKGHEFNSHIYNIKKSIDHPNVIYKDSSIQYFGNKLKQVLGDDNIQKILNNWSIVIVPPSLCREDPLYDNRLNRILDQADLSPALIDLFYIETNRPSAHLGGGIRNVQYYQEIFKHNRALVSQLKNKVIIFDDVITSGAQYKAIKNILLEINPNLEIRGLFLARTLCS